MKTNQSLPPLRALPRVFVPGADPNGPIELPSDEVDKIRKVLRLSPGAIIGVLPDDGSIVRCDVQNKVAIPIDVHWPNVEASLKLTIAQSLPKGEKLDEIVRACTEIGAAEFILFTSERTVVKWDEKKIAERLRRLQVIAREACEMSFRTRLPVFSWAGGLKQVLADRPNAIVLSEVEGESKPLVANGTETTVVVGPEGGWAPREVQMIGDRGVTLGPRVLRVDHAAPSAAAILLLSRP